MYPLTMMAMPWVTQYAYARVLVLAVVVVFALKSPPVTALEKVTKNSAHWSILSSDGASASASQWLRLRLRLRRRLRPGGKHFSEVAMKPIYAWDGTICACVVPVYEYSYVSRIRKILVLAQGPMGLQFRRMIQIGIYCVGCLP
ncbi:GL24777 [Drosophila persimilis]|uniref:GL24777 n=1 Tax=Drosophila persimilis TaxID=7234 RepID=B4H8V7_DROPE|nr:GL24777 [Drosophila persimilis]